MPKIVWENGVYQYEDHGDKDIHGRKVYRAYIYGEFDGYRYKRTRQELRRLRNECGKSVNIRTFAVCYGMEF